jgi:prevent-host-death family protein
MLQAMKRASVAELKARLSEFLAAARRGEEVIVTDRGKPIARLTGLSGAPRADAHTAQLIREGLVRPPRQKLPRDFWKRPVPSDPEGRLLDALIEERGESR